MAIVPNTDYGFRRMMIIYVDEISYYETTGELLPPETPIHVMHPVDNYPLCWGSKEEAGSYVCSDDPVEVTCDQCKSLITEE